MPSWTCASCGLLVRFQRDFAAPSEPAGWIERDGSWQCLACRRKAAVDAALADDDGSELDVSRRRRAALLTFELTREPSRPNKQIASLARTSAPMVQQRRRELIEAGVIEQPEQAPAAVRREPPQVAAKPNRDQRRAEKRAAIDAALKADPRRTDKVLAAEFTCSTPTIAKRRRALEGAGEIQVTVRKGFATTRANVQGDHAGSERAKRANTSNAGDRR